MDGAWPHVTVAALVLDQSRQHTLMIHRSPHVRSAKNCWSVPTGLLEHGEEIEPALLREVEEEVGLPGGKVLRPTAVFGNVVDGYHWVLILRAVVYPRVVDMWRNLEPDKHDRVMTMTVGECAHRARTWRAWELGELQERPAFNLSGGLAEPLAWMLGEVAR